MNLEKFVNRVGQNRRLRFMKRWLFRAFFIRLDRSLNFYKLDLKEWSKGGQDSPALSLASEADVQDEAAYDDGWFTKAEALRRLKEGGLLFILKQDGKSIYYEWVETNRAEIGYFDLRFAIPPGTAYLTGVYTIPERRGQGIAKKAGAEVLQDIKQRGIERTFLVIHPTNAPSIHVYTQFGYQLYQVAHYKRLGFLKAYIVRSAVNGKKKVFLGWGARRRDLWKAFYN